MNSYKSLVRNFIISVSLYDAIFAYAIYTVLFSIKGLSAFEISLLLTFWAGSSALLEIPTGALADYRNRKYMMVLAPLIKSLCFICWFLADGNFYLFGLGFLFWSIGSTFMSGTKEALLYDNLAYYNKEKDYAKVMGKVEFYKQVTQSLAVFVGGFLAEYNMDLALLCSIIPLCIGSLYASFLHTAPKVETSDETNYFGYISTAWEEISHSSLLLILFGISLAFGILGTLDEFDQLYYQAVHLPLWAFGIVGALGFGIKAISNAIAHKFEKLSQLYLLPISAGVLFVISHYYASVITIGAILCGYGVMSICNILIDAKTQHSISSTSRSTITSVVSLLINIVGAIVGLGFGTIADYLGITSVYGLAGLRIMISSIVIYRYRSTFITSHPK